MKLCPQCEFLYEDDQIFCDMDGEDLVYDTRAEVIPAPVLETIRPGTKGSRLKTMIVAVVGGLLLAALLTFAYASSRSLSSVPVSQSGPPESNPQQIPTPPNGNTSTPAAANPSQSPMNPEVASESATAGAEKLEDKTASPSTRTETASKAGENSVRSIDSRLTISTRLPALPALNPLPRLGPPRRLTAAKPTPPRPTATEKQKLNNQKLAQPSQKATIVEVKPPSQPVSKPSKVRAFLKKTGRILKKPFQL